MAATIAMVFAAVYSVYRMSHQKWGMADISCADCNVVLIVVDPLRADGIHAFGNSRSVTPHLDAIAQHSFVFHNTVAASSWTLPSAMSLMTGAYPSFHKVINKEVAAATSPAVMQEARLQSLRPDMVTLASVLRDHGYKTGGFAGGAALSSEYGFGYGFDEYESNGNFERLETVVPKALDFVRNNAEKKLFVFLHAFDPHGQVLPSGGLSYAYVDPAYDGRLTGSAEEQRELREEGVMRGHVSLTETDSAYLRALYDEKIETMDDDMGKFLASYQAITGGKKTLLIITSDHGEAFYEHGFIDHGMTLYDEMLHVPLIISVPGAKGSVIESQVRTVDVASTVFDLIGIDSDQAFADQAQGISLRPLMTGQVMKLDAYAETDYRHAVFLRMVQTWNGKKIIEDRESHVFEVYDLQKDPGETNNIYDANQKDSVYLRDVLFNTVQDL